MTEDDRKKVFWLLKKYSSYTAWKTLGDAFHAFTNGWEFAVKRVAAKDQDEFIVGALKRFWDGCKGFDRGLPHLKRGEHHVFRYKAGGELGWHALSAVAYAQDLMNPREYVFDWMANKDQVRSLWGRVNYAWSGLSAVVAPTSPDPKAFNREDFFDPIFEPFNFPSTLSNVPDPTAVTVESGEEVPLDGIWEPEWQDPSKKHSRVVGIRSLFTPIEPRGLQKGCMNYLVSGSIAPPYQDSRSTPLMPVRWRLIWEDTRYKDGVVPAEEAKYLAPAQQAPSSHKDSDALRAKAGEPCPRAGIWKSIDAKGISRSYKDGEMMVDFGSSYGLTIWQWIE